MVWRQLRVKPHANEHIGRCTKGGTAPGRLRSHAPYVWHPPGGTGTIFDMTAEVPQSARLYLDRDMAEPDVYSMAGGIAVVCSARCPDKQTPNEDAAVLIPVSEKAAVLVVADGLGGAQAGETAAEMAVRALKDAVRESIRERRPVRVAILDGIERANRDVQAPGVGAATTLAVAEVDGNVVRPYHVGDSMVLVMGQHGKVKLQTVAHSPVGFAVEAGLLDEHEALHHEDRHIVSNVIGTPNMRVEIGSPMELAPYDTLLLASDGLLDNLAVAEIIEQLRAGDLLAAAARLAEDARRRMIQPTEGLPSKPDDLTFVAFRPQPRQVSEAT